MYLTNTVVEAGKHVDLRYCIVSLNLLENYLNKEGKYHNHYTIETPQNSGNRIIDIDIAVYNGFGYSSDPTWRISCKSNTSCTWGPPRFLELGFFQSFITIRSFLQMAIVDHEFSIYALTSYSEMLDFLVGYLGLQHGKTPSFCLKFRDKLLYRKGIIQYIPAPRSIKTLHLAMDRRMGATKYIISLLHEAHSR